MISRIRVRQSLGDLALRASRHDTTRTLTILMYHAVTASTIDDDGQMSVSAARFERQMSELAATGVDVVDLADGVRGLADGAGARASVAVVFDDGFVGVHDHAAAALRRRRWPATVFVTTAWVGAAAMPLAEASLGRPLTWREIGALHDAGMSIGSHTHTHPRLSQQSDARVREELGESAARIADRVGVRPRTFAYPFGAFDSFDDRTREALADHEYVAGCTTVCGRNGRTTDPLALRRIRVSWCDGEGEIAKMLAGGYDWYAWVQRVQTLRSAQQTGATPC